MLEKHYTVEYNGTTLDNMNLTAKAARYIFVHSRHKEVAEQGEHCFKRFMIA